MARKSCREWEEKIRRNIRGKKKREKCTCTWEGSRKEKKKKTPVRRKGQEWRGDEQKIFYLPFDLHSSGCLSSLLTCHFISLCCCSSGVLSTPLPVTVSLLTFLSCCPSHSSPSLVLTVFLLWLTLSLFFPSHSFAPLTPLLQLPLSLSCPSHSSQFLAPLTLTFFLLSLFCSSHFLVPLTLLPLSLSCPSHSSHFLTPLTHFFAPLTPLTFLPLSLLPSVIPPTSLTLLPLSLSLSSPSPSVVVPQYPSLTSFSTNGNRQTSRSCLQKRICVQYRV